MNGLQEDNDHRVSLSTAEGQEILLMKQKIEFVVCGFVWVFEVIEARNYPHSNCKYGIVQEVLKG
jgi:hypothetical protein